MTERLRFPALCLVVLLLSLMSSRVALGSTRVRKGTQAAPQTVSKASDFNGDGYGDLAVGVPGEDVGAATDTGAVSILYGSATGLSATSNQFWDETATGSATDASGDLFGWAEATGDFNGDGFKDLAVGVPFKEVGIATDAGAVSILYGSASGLSATGSQQWNQDLLGTNPSETNDGFGASVATGDVNGDGFDDLAVGVPGEGVGSIASAGAADIILGSAAGLTAAGNEDWSQNSAGVLNKSETDDEFGLSVTIGDFNGDGFGDLGVGVPLEDLVSGGSTRTDAGGVNVLYGSATGLTSTDDDFWSQDATGIVGIVESGDWFGYAIGAGDFDGNGFDDLIVGVPLEDITQIVEAGGANVIYGSSTGLSSAGNQFWDQNSTGINGKAEAGDTFAASVSAGDFDGNGFDDAAFGVPGEDVGSRTDAGAVNVIYGKASGLDSANADIWDQDTPNIIGVAENGDIFGASVTVADFGNGPEDDLVSGVPWEDIGSIADAGLANVIYGSPSDLTSTGNQAWQQDTTGILDMAEAGDEFGFGLGEPGTGNASRPLASLRPSG